MRAPRFAVLAGDPKLDDDAITAALSSGAGYLGAMGSRRVQARRGRTIAAPIGLDTAR